MLQLVHAAKHVRVSVSVSSTLKQMLIKQLITVGLLDGLSKASALNSCDPGPKRDNVHRMSKYTDE